MTSALLLTILLAGPDEKPMPPPLTDEQRTAIQKLVQTAQAEMTRLRGQLDDKQKQLARHYAEYDLDNAAVQKLHAEIVAVQRELLASYHAMQVELRKVVGRERFVTLRQRIDGILNAPPRKEK